MSATPISIHLKEWEHLAPDKPESVVKDIFLEDDAQIKLLAKTLSESNTLNIEELRKGLSIQARSFVGSITLGNVRIIIHPKISGAPFMHLLRYAYNLRDLNILTTAEYDTENQTFQELIINQFIAEVSELVARGLLRKYVRADDNLASPRGKIQIQRIANQGGIIQATLPCTYHPRLEDCLINQVLLQGLYLAARLTEDSNLRLKLYRLVRFFQNSVAAIRLDYHTLKKLNREMDRLTTAYIPAITIIEILLASEGIALEEQQPRVRLPGFLFDMNLFFQALLSRFLQEHLQDYTVQDQYKIHGMIAYDPAHNPQKRLAPAPRPDYVILRRSQVVAILDAKYRDLWEQPLPPHMLYQLAIYALSQAGGIEAGILYPTIQPDAREARILIRDPTYGSSRAQVVLRPVNLLEMAALISSPKSISKTKHLATFAEHLTFGNE
jgi:5-methylcytosine-specific restriction enzyme subunit McrC